MRRTIIRGAQPGTLAFFALLSFVSCNAEPGSSPTNVMPTPMVETRVGTVSAHQLAFVDFSMAQPGLVTLRIDPILLLTLRSGKVPEELGTFISNSDNGGLTFSAPAGTNSVVVGNPFDEAKAFSLSITHP
jgi:hypothetical protein